MEAHNQPWEGGSVDGLELIVDEVVLGAALTEVNLCGELDEEDGAIGEGVPVRTCSHEQVCSERISVDLTVSGYCAGCCPRRRIDL